MVACERCESPEVFPPFLAVEGVLAMDMGEPRITIGANMVGGNQRRSYQVDYKI